MEVEEIESLGFKFINDNNKYGWYLDISQNRVLTWCHSNCVSLEFDFDDNGYNNTLFDFEVKKITDIEKVISILKPNI